MTECPHVLCGRSSLALVFGHPARQVSPYSSLLLKIYRDGINIFHKNMYTIHDFKR